MSGQPDARELAAGRRVEADVDTFRLGRPEIDDDPERFRQAGDGTLELFEQLPVSQAANRADLEKHPGLLKAHNPLLSSKHAWLPRVAFRIAIQ